MKEGFARVDDALIDRVFQPLVDEIGEHTSFGGFRLARVCIDLAAVAWILSQVSGVAATVGGTNLGLEVFRSAMIVVGLGSMSVLRNLFQRSDSAGGGRMRGAANPLRVAMHVHRVVCLLWLIVLLIKTAPAPPGLESCALLAMGIFMTTSVYIGACSHRPTKRRESRARGRSWRLAVSQAR